jgi:hypothetical protein
VPSGSLLQPVKHNSRSSNAATFANEFYAAEEDVASREGLNLRWRILGA